MIILPHLFISTIHPHIFHFLFLYSPQTLPTYKTTFILKWLILILILILIIQYLLNFHTFIPKIQYLFSTNIPVHILYVLLLIQIPFLIYPVYIVLLLLNLFVSNLIFLAVENIFRLIIQYPFFFRTLPIKYPLLFVVLFILIIHLLMFPPIICLIIGRLIVLFITTLLFTLSIVIFISPGIPVIFKHIFLIVFVNLTLSEIKVCGSLVSNNKYTLFYPSSPYFSHILVS